MLRAEAVHRHEDERRSCRRATLQWVVLVFFGGDQWGKLVDLSEKGMCFQFEHPPALRQSINFTFEAMGCMAIPSEGHEGSVFGDSIQATGRVKWTREFERTAGVEFLELSPRSRDQIRYWISSGASQDAAAPSRELQQEWNKKKSKKADRKAAPFTAAALAGPAAPVEPPPSPAKAPFEPREEVFESDPASAGSDIEVVWEPEPSLAPPTIDEPATPHRKWPREPERDAAFTPVSPDEPALSHRKWPGEAEPEDTYTSPTLEGPAAEHSRKWPLDAKSESAFAPPEFDEPAASAENWPAEPEPQFEPSFLPPTLDEATAVELREKLDALSHGKRALEPEPEDSAMPPSLDEPVAHPGKWESRSEPAPAPEEFVPSDRRGFWGSKGAFASQPADFEVPGMLHHDERQRRGQTLELKQHRARFGVIAVLGLLATLGALAGIIRFTSKFNERADATDVSRPSENNVAPSRAEADAAPGARSPFLVEVVDANNHRSVLVFSTEARSNKSGHVQDSSLSETSVMAVQEPREETKTSATKQASRDFTLIAPHAASSVAGANSAVEAPALTTQAPASVDAPLQNLPSPAMPGAADRAPTVGGEVQPARLIHAVLPSYPQIARSSRVAGDVTLDALVDESGNVLDVKVIAGPLLLRDAAMAALRQWKYEPARLDGQPTPMHLTVTVKFQANLASH